MSRIAAAGRVLVAAQFALIGWLIWPLTPQAWSAPALALLAGAVALGLWTLLHNRPGNFNIRPEPKASGRLVTGAGSTAFASTINGACVSSGEATASSTCRSSITTERQT